MAAGEAIKQEWRRFRHDRPGARFQNHRARMQHRPTWLTALRLVLGLALVAAGVALLFLPGPGLLGMVFGLALLAGMSRRLAAGFDRAEPWVRARARAARAWWRRRSTAARGALIALAAAVVAAGGVVVWTQWLGPRLTG